MRGRASKSTPGSATRFGPAKRTGETRGDQTGSVRMFNPAVWISRVAWPTMVIVRSSTCGAGRAFCGTGTSAGQAARWPLKRQRIRSPNPLGGVPPGLKKRTPSKWSLTGPA